jgi:hypothetical protein
MGNDDDERLFLEDDDDEEELFLEDDDDELTPEEIAEGLSWNEFECAVCGREIVVKERWTPHGPRACGEPSCQRIFKRQRDLEAQIADERSQRKKLQAWVIGIVAVAFLIRRVWPVRAGPPTGVR